MTANQINYQKHLEDVRTHKANEALSERQAVASETSAAASAQQALVAAKNADTNVLNADTNRISAEASTLSAMASQTMAAASYMNAETERMYREATILLEQAKQQESERHNVATETAELLKQGETKRHNVESEWLQSYDTQTKSGIEAANRLERAREADQSNETTRRGQTLTALTNFVQSGAQLLKGSGKLAALGKLIGG